MSSAAAALPAREGALATGPLAFVDVETTGGHPAWHRITEIAIVAMRDGEVEWEWSTLVNPGCSIPPSIQRLTGITPLMVADAPQFASIAEEVFSRLADRRFVAHNARFDYGFVRAELRRAGRNFSAPLACTVRLSRELYPEAERHNLDALIARHGLECSARHRALPDAQVLAQLWRRLVAAWPAPQLDAAIERVSRRPALPAHLPVDLIDDLPEACGVYRFYGENDALIYVGKSKNLRERVLAHFMGATRDAKSQRLAAQTRRIEWTETAGELGALLLESQLVRELQPVYNRRLRGGGENWTWLIDDAGGTPRLQALEGGVPSGVDAFGLYRTPRQAKNSLITLARDNKLCLRVLGLESGDGSCFAYQVGRCAGACVGAESSLKHALRLKLLLASVKLRSWPYSGSIAIEESSALGLRHWHIVEGWQYRGTVVADDGDGRDIDSTAGVDAGRAGFDADVYRILCRHLKPNARNLRPWPPRA